LLLVLAASGVDVRSKGLTNLLIEPEDIHDGTAVSEWPCRLERLGREHGFIKETSASQLTAA
jgi:hypothetical protein